MKNKNIVYLTITLGIVLILLYGFVKWVSDPGQYDEFAKCLTEKGVKMYGTDWCSFCNKQKAEFGKSFKHIDYVNCDSNKAECNSAGVQGYPTWYINNQLYSGLQPLQSLATLSGCEL